MMLLSIGSVSMWGQSATFDTSTPGTLKIKASGDLTNYTIHDEVTTTVFTNAAEGKVFTGTASNTGVEAGTEYNPSMSYYRVGEITYGDALNSDKPTDGDSYQYYTVATSKCLKSDYSDYKILNAYYYEGWVISDGVKTIETTISQNGDWQNGTYYRAVLVSGDISSSTNIGNAQDGVIEYNGITAIPLSPDNINNYIDNVTTISPKSGANLYVSINGGDKVGKSSAFLWEDGMTIYNATLGENVAITNNNAYFGPTGEGVGFITTKTEPVNQNFKDFLASEINTGNYTSVVFEQNGGDITIDKEIVFAILFGNKTSREHDSSVSDLDLGATTISSLSGVFDYTTSQNLVSLTLPKLPIVGNEMTLSSYILATSYTWDSYKLRTVCVPDGYTKIGTLAFKNQSALTSVYLPEGITEVGVEAFAGCASLPTIELPNTLLYIDECAFLGDVKLESVTYPGYEGDYDTAFPPHLKKIYKEAFSGCEKLANFKFNTELEFIGNSAFFLNHTIGGQKPTLDFPASLKYLGPGSFLNRNFAEVYFHGDEAPICPVGPYYDDKQYIEMDVAAFSAITHMGNNGFTQMAKTRGGENTASGYPYANRENYYNHEYFTILHFPAGITTEQAKTYKDITRKYETVDDLSTFVYNATPIPCGEEPVDNVRSFKDYNTTVTWRVEEGDYRHTNAGHIDTYLGRQKIWPSKPQWMRAYTTVANGVEWNGVKTYRPEITSDMLALMEEDGLKIWDPSTSQYLSIADAAYSLNETSANLYNASLEGAVHAGEVSDYFTNQSDVNNYNAELPGAVTDGNHNYTKEQAKAYNAKLPGAVSTSTVKEPAIEGHDAVFYADDEKEWVNGVQYIKSTLVWHDAVDATYYAEDEIWHNAGNNGNYKIEDKVDLDGYYTAEYLAGMMDSWEYVDNVKTLDDDGETQLYYYKGTKVKAGATALSWGTEPVVKSPAVAAYWEVTSDSKVAPSDNIKEPAVEARDAVYYTQDQADLYNAELTGHVTTEDTYTLTEEEAIAYNAGLTGAKKLNDPWHYYDEASANTYNAGLTGAMKNDGEGNYGTLPVATTFADYISKIAYQSTRRFVLADDGSNQGDSYDVELSGANWWTIVFPFNMTKKQIDEVFGIGTHVCLFSGVDRGVGQDGTKHITLKFQNDVYAHSTPLTSYIDDASGNHYAEFTTEAAVPGDDDVVIKAFEAYMIRPTKGDQDAATFKIENPKIEQGAVLPTVIKANTTIANRNTAKYQESSDHTEYRFVGNLLKQLVDESGNFVTNKIPQYSYMYAKKKNDSKYKFWFNTSENITWAINKCVVQATAKDGGYKDSQDYFGLNQASGVKQISIFGDFYDEYNSEEDEATDIQNITIIAGDGEDSEVVYNLNGQMVNPNAASKGVYIKGGKKVFVK